MTDQRQWRTLSEVYGLFGYKSVKSAMNAVTRGTFPVKTYILVGKRVLDVSVMEAFFQMHRDEGMKILQKGG